jgi:hypothetical protein
MQTHLTRLVVIAMFANAFGGLLGTAGVEQVGFAESAYAENSRPALFERGEATIAAAAASAAAILRAPWVGLSLAD